MPKAESPPGTLAESETQIHVQRAPAVAPGALSETQVHKGPESATAAPAQVQPTYPMPKAMPMIDEAELRRRGAIQLLSILQREGRLVDFLMEDVTSYGRRPDWRCGTGYPSGLQARDLSSISRSPRYVPEPDEAAVRIEAGLQSVARSASSAT